MLRTRHRAVLMMVCAIAAVGSLSSTAWADALAQLQYPMALGTTGTNAVAIAPTYASSTLPNGEAVLGAAVDFGSNAGGSTYGGFGGLVVTQSNFYFLSPVNGGTGTVESGLSAVQDAINQGGQSGNAFSANTTPYPSTQTNVGFISSYAANEQTGQTVIYAYDNTVGNPNSGVVNYSSWAGD